jgi:hypothetical protein
MQFLQGWLAAILVLVYCLILPVTASGEVQPIGIDFGPEVMSVLPGSRYARSLSY